MGAGKGSVDGRAVGSDVGVAVGRGVGKEVMVGAGVGICVVTSPGAISIMWKVTTAPAKSLLHRERA